MTMEQETRKKLYEACDGFQTDVDNLWTEMREVKSLIKKDKTNPKLEKIKNYLDIMYNCNYEVFGEDFENWVLNTSKRKLTRNDARTFLSDWLTIALKGTQSGLSADREKLWKICEPYIPNCELKYALDEKKIKLEDYKKTKALILSRITEAKSQGENSEIVGYMTVGTQCAFLNKKPNSPLGGLSKEQLTVLYVLMMREERQTKI